MKRLYLMRHGQTVYNLEKRVQGRCDSPLTELGIEQARRAGAWLAAQGAAFDRICSSPIGRAYATAESVRSVLESCSTDAASIPAVEAIDGLKERCYGPFEGGPQADVPADVWDPEELLVPYGGEERRAARPHGHDAHRPHARRVRAHPARREPRIGHAAVQKAWEHAATCDQGRPLGNCCVLVFDFDEVAETFSCTKIHNG